MVRYRNLIVIASLLVGWLGEGLSAAEPDFERIFDGKTLQGWTGDPKLWSVQNGAITGVTTDEEPLPYNKFLIWYGEVENFHLRAKVRLIGNSNSGIQYRSVHLKDEGEHVVGGYQCDIHPKAENNGMLYHERGRGVVALHGQKVIVDNAGDKWITGTTGPVQQSKLDEWNTFEIIATGNKLVHKLNGKTCAEIIDHHRDGRLMKGVVAFQVHRGPAMQVQVTDIELKRLPAGGMLSLKDAPIPADAQKVPGRARRPRGTKSNSQNGAKPPAVSVAMPGQGGGKFSGTWVAEFKNPRGIRKWTFHLKQENGALGGSVTMPNGASIQLDDGKVDGGNISFKQNMKAQGVEFKYSGVLKDGTIEFSRVTRNGVQRFIAKKSVIDASRDVAPPKRAASREPTATLVSDMNIKDGFKVELLYSVPGQQQGSWVNLCTDDKGRLLVSDQFGGLYRISPPPPGTPVRQQDIESVPAKIRAVNGMVWAQGALYVGVNDYEKTIPSGLYRITDSDGDDDLDHVELLQELQAKGDHGVHAVVPTPDGKALFLITGNGTIAPELSNRSQVPQVWGEDHLLPSMPDGRGHKRGVLGPGGIVYRVSLDGHEFEAYANGFRNVFDAAVNRDGELFTYDADMEYDFNTPWYRPTRICHVVSGAEFGWRNGAGKRMPFYADNLPGVLDIGPGSPTGMTFGYGAKFPAKYQNALYALDWSWGKLYAVHLEPSGSTYTATKEEFITGVPLPITDAIIHPVDGAMYFTIGGRRVQSGLYRVTYVGDESTAPADSAPHHSEDRILRHSLEAFHGRQDPKAVEAAWPYLDHNDRFIRFAARTAIEHQPVAEWGDKALAESDLAKQVEALLALARVTGVCPLHRTETTPAVDTGMRDKLLAAVISIDVANLALPQQQTLLRTTQIILNRFGRPDESMVEKLIAKFDPLFPAITPETNWLLCETLAWLQSPTVAEKAMALIHAAPTQEEQMQYARSIRMLKSGWTRELREAYFEWFLKAANYRGGASFEKFIEFIRDDAVASLSESEKTSMAELLATKPVKKSVLENLGEVFAGRSTTEWTLDELSAAARRGLKHRDFASGQRMFAATGCYACHRFGDQGGMTGPDLTSAGRRYSAHDLLDQVINPSKVINDQFSAVQVLTLSGIVHTGVIVNLKGDSITLNTDLTDPSKRVSIDRNEIDEMKVSKVSAMPTGLLNRMTQDEILDLIAYLISSGDSKHQFFEE